MKTNQEYTHLLHGDKPEENKRSGNIRGISARHMWIDEELLTPEEAQVIITRISDNAVIFTGQALHLDDVRRGPLR